MNIKDFIKKHNITILLIQLSAFGILFLLSKLFFDGVYLFEWTARHNYLYVWIIAALFTFFGKEIIGIFITAGAVLGVPLGEIIGRVIMDIRTCSHRNGAWIFEQILSKTRQNFAGLLSQVKKF